MTTKEQLTQRVAELEADITRSTRDRASLLAALDLLSDSSGIRGVRVTGDFDASEWRVTVMGSGVSETDATKVAALFANMMAYARAIMAAGVEQVVGVAAPDMSTQGMEDGHGN